MPMRMRRRISHWWVAPCMDVLMMLVVYVRVVMVHHLVLVLVLVPFGEV